jgi:signal transduction histidine kinase
MAALLNYDSLKGAKSRQKRYRNFVPAAMFVCLLHFFFCWYHNILPPGLVMLTCGFLLVVCMLIYEKGYRELAGFLTVLFLDINVTSVIYFEGLNTGGYLNFFPVIVASGLMANLNKLTKANIVTITLNLVFIAIAYFISEDGPQYISFPLTVQHQLLFMNMVLNFSVVTWFCIIVIFIQRKSYEKVSEARLQAEQASLAKMRFLSVMSHELRTPLNGIIGITNILREEDNSTSNNEYVKLLQHSGNHMLRMIESILQFNKLETGKMELSTVDFNVKHLLDEVHAQFQIPFRKRGLVFEVRTYGDIDIWVHGDDTKMVQVLNNLLSNAMKFTKSGSVIVDVTADPQKSAIQKLSFSVSDTGIGIDEAEQKEIFNDFTQASKDTTREYGGTGLGLTISKKMVELMGGQMELTSKKNEGSKFSFALYLPESNKLKIKSIETPLIKEAKVDNNLKILVAEDNTVNAMVVGKFLKKWNIAYDIASDGKQVLNKMQQQNYNLILMDLDMPELDGYGATATLRSWNNNIPIIAFTAALLDRTELNALQDRGFDDCIEKPFTPVKLHEKIKAHTAASNWN